MDFFDASDEMHTAIQMFISETGETPTKVHVSPFLYQWLAKIQKEEFFLKGKADLAAPNRIETHIGELELVIDEALSDYEIIPE